MCILRLKEVEKYFELNRFIVGNVTGYCVSETILCLLYDSISNKLMLRTKVFTVG